MNVSNGRYTDAANVSVKEKVYLCYGTGLSREPEFVA